MSFHSYQTKRSIREDKFGIRSGSTSEPDLPEGIKPALAGESMIQIEKQSQMGTLKLLA